MCIADFRQWKRPTEIHTPWNVKRCREKMEREAKEREVAVAAEASRESLRRRRRQE